MSIKSREDANKYYTIVNELIDDYIDKWKIRPANLRKYLKEGSSKIEKFITRNGLADIAGIKQVINDVIDDRVHMEKDGVLTFENFKLFESDEFKVTSLIQCLYKGVGKADIKSEKVLADHFDANLSQIDVVDSEKHLFKINDWENKDLLVIIYSNDEFEIIKNNIKEYLLHELLKKEVEFVGMKLNIESFVDISKFEKSIDDKLTDEKLTDLVNDAIKNEYSKFILTKTDTHFIWKKEKEESK